MVDIVVGSETIDRVSGIAASTPTDALVEPMDQVQHSVWTDPSLRKLYRVGWCMLLSAMGVGALWSPAITLFFAPSALVLIVGAPLLDAIGSRFQKGPPC